MKIFIEELTDLFNRVEEDIKYISDITDKVVQHECNSLDQIMKELNAVISSVNECPTIDIERYCLELTNILYFMGDRVENIGTKSDISLQLYKEVYNKAYLNNQIKDQDKKNKTTVAENQAIAQESAKKENIVNSIYERAYKMIKYKIDAGYKMVDVLRKILTKRIADLQSGIGV